MITTTLSGVAGTAHALVVTPSTHVDVAGVSEAKRREIRVRVCASFAYLGLAAPGGTVALPAYADAASDLAVALSLAPQLAHGYDAAIGELSLAGDVRAVRGIIPRLVALRDSGVRRCLVPACQREAAAVPGIEVAGLAALGAAPQPMPAWQWEPPSYPDPSELPESLSEAREALAEALGRGRDVLLIGVPGSGRVMLARRAMALMPALDDSQRDEIAQIWSASGLGVPTGLGRPFRAPHHTASLGGLVGTAATSTTFARPGEITLAHGGVLLLDEVDQIAQHAIEGLEDAMDRSTVHGMPAHPRVVIAACHPDALARMEGRKAHRRFIRRFDQIRLPARITW